LFLSPASYILIRALEFSCIKNNHFFEFKIPFDRIIMDLV